MLPVKIGTTAEEMISLDELETPLQAPKFEFLDYEDTVRLQDNTERGLGFPVARWIYPYLEAEERNQLKEFCPGASATVYICTKLPNDTYGNYQATMIWLKQEPVRTMDLKTDFVIEFRNLVALEEAS